MTGGEAAMPKRNAVCLCTDGRMLIPALFVADAIKSASSRPAKPFDLLIFTPSSDVSPAHLDWMARRGIGHCGDLDMSRFREVDIVQDRLSPATLVKLTLAEHLAGCYDKVLYLDADLTIHDDVTPIFDLDTGAFALAAVPSARIWAGQRGDVRRKTEEHFRALGMTAPYRFFNSGVLLIDVDKWNRADLGARALAFIRKDPQLCYLPDEHALNGVLDGDIAELSPVWNMRPARHWHAATHEIARPVIIHHMGEDKPWRRYGYRKRLFPDRTAYRLYQEFLKGTPWEGWLDEQWTRRDVRKTIVWEARRITRRLRGRPEDPTRRQRRDYVEAFRRYCAEGRFADVDQGIVVSEHGNLRLKKRAAAA